MIFGSKDGCNERAKRVAPGLVRCGKQPEHAKAYLNHRKKQLASFRAMTTVNAQRLSQREYYRKMEAFKFDSDFHERWYSIK